MALQETVEELLGLLEKVECSRADIPSLDGQLGNTFVKRLREVADLVELQLNGERSGRTQDIADEEDATPSAKRRRLCEQQITKTDSDDSDDSDENSKENLSTNSGIHPSQEQARRSSLYSRVLNPSLPVPVDEYAQKNLRDAEKIVDKLGISQKSSRNYSCGVNYTSGDEKEKKISDGIKIYLKNHLPVLRYNREIFHYMVWAAFERLECDHCRKCPNEQ